MLQGWPLVGIASVLLVALQFAVLSAGGSDEAGLRMLVRASARASFLLFLLPYLAAPARRLWPNAATRWLLRNRRHLGVSFAVAHFLHLLDIWLLTLLLGDAFETNPLTVIVGGLSYVLLAGMTLTSFDRTARWLGPRRWKWLHRSGLHLLWFVFAQSWTFSALQSPGYLPLALASWGSLGIRIAAWRSRRAPARSVGEPVGADAA